MARRSVGAGFEEGEAVLRDGEVAGEVRRHSAMGCGPVVWPWVT